MSGEGGIGGAGSYRRRRLLQLLRRELDRPIQNVANPWRTLSHIRMLVHASSSMEESKTSGSALDKFVTDENVAQREKDLRQEVTSWKEDAIRGWIDKGSATPNCVVGMMSKTARKLSEITSGKTASLQRTGSSHGGDSTRFVMVSLHRDNPVLLTCKTNKAPSAIQTLKAAGMDIDTNFMFRAPPRGDRLPPPGPTNEEFRCRGCDAVMPLPSAGRVTLPCYGLCDDQDAQAVCGNCLAVVEENSASSDHRLFGSKGLPPPPNDRESDSGGPAPAKSPKKKSAFGGMMHKASSMANKAAETAAAHSSTAKKALDVAKSSTSVLHPGGGESESDKAYEAYWRQVAGIDTDLSHDLGVFDLSGIGKFLQKSGQLVAYHGRFCAECAPF